MTERLGRTADRRAAGGGLAVTVFGSSTTAGYGASDPAVTGYAPVMRAGLVGAFGTVSVRNRGESGETVLEMERRLGRVVADGADLVVWQVGSNDGPRGVALDRVEAVLAEGIARIGAGGADLVLMEPQWSRALLSFEDYGQCVRLIGERFGVPVFARSALMRRWGAETGLGIDGLSPDGTHMGDAGYRLLGEAVAEFILARSEPPGR